MLFLDIANANLITIGFINRLSNNLKQRTCYVIYETGYLHLPQFHFLQHHRFPLPQICIPRIHILIIYNFVLYILSRKNPYLLYQKCMYKRHQLHCLSLFRLFLAINFCDLNDN